MSVDDIRITCEITLTEIAIRGTREIYDGMDFISSITSHPVRHEATV